MKTLRQAGVAGVNTLAFKLKRLKPGRYVAAVIATAGADAAQAEAAFKIIKR